MPNCASWPIETDCCDLPDGVDIDERWVEIASGILWYGSGMRVGTCPVTIRPCLRRCGGGSGFPWTPYKGADGQWRNLGCGCIDDCSCTALSEIVLPGPVASITEVVIDTDILDPSAYRLDTVNGGYRLVRVDGGSWPDCSDMTAECGELGSFCVTYEQGIEPDALAIAAVSEAACELTKACLDDCDTCRLPANAQLVARRGVAISLETGIEWIRNLPMVAAFLDAVNPNGLQSKSTVFSPDISRPRITPNVVS